MTTKQKGTIMCDVCKTVECRHDYPKGIPAYCLAKRFPGIIEETKGEYSTREVIEIYKAAAKVVTDGYGRWPCIQEAIEFARELKFRKIGFASCVGLIRELGMITELFMGAGLDGLRFLPNRESGCGSPGDKYRI